ncbi:MAG TPA: Ig-like domain-containing protein, partial [Acholeplasmataceae bacterium]|nr:Ig-like domain-containing protein [Acholeplasmataceae bacterium]
MKKIIFGLFLIMSFIVLASCTSPITITGDQDVTLKEGDTFVLDLSTDDEKGLTFESSNEGIISVDASGKITAIAEGSATVTVTSKSQTDVSVVINVTVTKRIVITSTIDEVILTEGQQETISYEANDDVSFTSSSTDVFIVDDNGIISAVAEGQASLRITSDTDPSVYLDIDVVIRKVVTLTIDDYEQEMVVGEQGQITVTSNDGYMFESGNEDVLTVSETGVVAAIGAGTTTITITSSYDESVEETITITIYATVDTLTIDGSSTMNYYDEQTLTSTLSPSNAYPYITWASTNEEIATIDEEGVITILGVGAVTFTATSNLNELVTDAIEVTIINQVIVDASMTNGTLDYEGLTYTYGISLFSNIDDALDHVMPYATILVNDGQYTAPLNIDIDGLELKAIEDLVELGSVEVNAKDVSLNGFNMQGGAFIHVTALAENVAIMNITASGITQDFIMISDSKGTVTIKHNQLSNITGDAITITGYESGTMLVSHNQISDVETAILITPAETVDVSTEIKVERNDISDVTDGIVIEDANSIHAYARFNSVVNATGYLAQSNSGNNVEFTLN